jgi:hypothetical protein
VTNASVGCSYQPMITIMFMIVDCNWDEGVGLSDAYQGLPCWEGIQAIFNAITLFTLAIFLQFTQCILLFDMNSTVNIMNLFQGRQEGLDS